MNSAGLGGDGGPVRHAVMTSMQDLVLQSIEPQTEPRQTDQDN